ncbi:methionyl-trna formyltransferase [Stylonychia lemnae]|uniref:methionyl-tRNA formyltransferase n=1 Tax=Stylonychia lemnae TaxID=5949 RepID=A0A078B162_STYLE|nr:methionyl-trna formyltransferase [Stylonychia lemnae]|eukprot:CDW88350.1 methionyl-trna formyltransferase [Stylonychia lemnae]
MIKQATLKHSLVIPPNKKPRTPLATYHEFIKQNSIPIFQVFQDKTDFETLEQKLIEQPQDYGVVASFGHMIPDKIIDKFDKGMYVIHPSLLPKYRGACPIQHAILNREKETGVSIIEISKNKFDAGAILWQYKCQIDESTQFGPLSQLLAEQGGIGMLEVLSNLEKHKENAIIQDPTKVTSAKMIPSEFGLMEFQELDALSMQVKFNALYDSNTRPKAILLKGFEDKPFNQTPVYFDQLKMVPSVHIDEILNGQLKDVNDIPAGSLYINSSKFKDMLLIKCQGDKYQWVFAKEITLTGYGKMKIVDFNQKILQNKSFVKQANPQFKFQLS